MKRILGLLLVAMGVETEAPAAEPVLAVVEKKGAALGFYDAQGKRLAGVAVGEHPHEIVFSPDRKFAYVSENGMLWMTDPGQGGNSIAVIDVAKRQKVGSIDLGANRRPHGMDVDRATGRLVVTVENPAGLLLVDPVARKVLRRYDTKGKQPHMVLLDAKAEWAWVSNSGSGTLAAVNLASGEVHVIPVGENPQGAAITRDGKTIYFSVMASNKIAVIDAAKRAMTGEIPTGKGPARLALTGDEKTLVYNLQLEPPGAGFADVASRKQVARTDLPGRPLSLTLSNDRKTAYLGIQEEDQIAVVSVADRKVMRYLKTPKGAGPDPVLEVQ